MPTKEWTFEIESRSHKVEFIFDMEDGERTIRVDGNVIVRLGTVFDIGKRHEFQVDGHSSAAV